MYRFQGYSSIMHNPTAVWQAHGPRSSLLPSPLPGTSLRLQCVGVAQFLPDSFDLGTFNGRDSPRRKVPRASALWEVMNRTETTCTSCQWSPCPTCDLVTKPTLRDTARSQWNGYAVHCREADGGLTHFMAQRPFYQGSLYSARTPSSCLGLVCLYLTDTGILSFQISLSALAARKLKTFVTCL